MAVHLGNVQSVQTSTRLGYGFTISDHQGRSHVMVVYRTVNEARDARAQVAAAFANAVEAIGALPSGSTQP